MTTVRGTPGAPATPTAAPASSSANDAPEEASAPTAPAVNRGWSANTSSRTSTDAFSAAPRPPLEPTVDPASVVTRNTALGASAEIQGIVMSHLGAPRTAELVAKTLAAKYGPFTASNTEENRQAILSNLRWIADTTTGLRYDDARLESSSPTTQSPNETLSRGAGVCRDIHTAMSAVMASLINAHQENGTWVPGSPTGQESRVQSLGFANPSEYHVFMVYRDPATSRWNALEYGKSYNLQAETSEEAFRSLPGYVSGYQRYRITGWDTRPVVAEAGVVGAAAAREFIGTDEGRGVPGETRVLASGDGVKVTAFVTPELSLSTKVGASDMGNGLDGGIKFNYHHDFDNADAQGHVRVAGGMYTQAFEASRFTGERAAADRVAYRTFVLGMQVDGKYEGKPHQLIGEHLKANYGVDVDSMVGVPIGTGPGANGAVWGAVPDYSHLDVGAEGVLSGHEQVNKNLSVDWRLKARYQTDLVKAGVELATSEGTSARTLGTDALQTDFAVAVTHTSDSGLTTRFEAGGTQYLARPLDPQVTAAGDHHAVLTIAPASGAVNFGVVARGQTIDGKFIPVNSVGVSLNLNPSPNVQVGVGVQSVFPDGDAKKIGKNVQVSAGVKVEF